METTITQTFNDLRPVEVDVNMTAMEWTRFSWSLLYRLKKGWFWMMLLVSVYAVIQVALCMASGGYGGALVPVIVLVIIAASAFVGAKIQMKRDTAYTRPKHYIFDAEGIRTRLPGQSGFTSWSDIEKAVETDWGFIMYESQSQLRAFPIPKKSFSRKEELNQFRKLLEWGLDQDAKIKSSE